LVRSMEDKLRSIRQKLEHVQDNHLTIDEFGEFATGIAGAIEKVQDNHLTVDEFGEFATGMAGAHERVWKRFEDMITDIQRTLANNASATKEDIDSATAASVQKAELMITDFFEQLSGMGSSTSPKADVESERALQSVQAQVADTAAQVANIERNNAVHASSITGIQAQLTKINELVMARRESAKSTERRPSKGSAGAHERLVGIETMMKGHLNSEEFRKFKSYIEVAVSEVAELAQTMQTRLDDFDNPFKSNITLDEYKVPTSIEGALKEIAGVVADVRARVYTIESSTQVQVSGSGDRADEMKSDDTRHHLTSIASSLDSKADVSRVLQMENAVQDFNTRLNHIITIINAKADAARVERGEVSITQTQTKITSIEEVVSELADAMTAYLETSATHH